MFEKTPKIVYFPELGSTWAPSQVSHANNCGLDCTPWSWRAAEPGATHFPVLATGRRMVSCTRVTSQTLIESLSAYPRWLVITAITLIAAALVWIVAKLLEWTLWFLILVILVGGLAWAIWAIVR
jgi:hypothetical protein